MRNCPRCSELIGDSLSRCPMCKAVFTEDEIKEMREQEYREKSEQAARIADELKAFNKDRKIMATMFLCGIFIPFLLVFMVGTKLATYIAVIVFGVLVVGSLVFGFVTEALFCPHCGRMLFRNWGDHCQNCGKRLW